MTTSIIRGNTGSPTLLPLASYKELADAINTLQASLHEAAGS